MNMRWAWTLPLLSSLAGMLAAVPAGAQGPYGSPYGNQMAAYSPQGMGQPSGPYGPMQMAPLYAQGGMQPGMHPTMNHPAMQPAGYGPTPDAYGTYGSASPEMMGGMGMEGACPQCGGMGCEMCGGGHGGLHNGLLGDVFGLVAPYSDGGCAALRWFDVSADAMYLKREEVGRNLVVSTFGVNGVGGVALQTSQFEFEEELGFRFTGQTQVGPGSNVEFTYYGLFFYDDTATAVANADNLFSVFSDFGTDPPPQGFVETDNANLHSITYRSKFDNFELNFRQRWMAPNCRYQGSWLIGVRYFKLDETFSFTSIAPANGQPGFPPPQAFIVADVNNSLTGMQIGGDVWICLLPGLRLGAEAKGGVYGNHMNINNTFNVNTQPIGPNNPFSETQVRGDVAFVGDASVTATYRINYQWTVRAGYQALLADGVALAVENLNPQPPLGPFPPPAENRAPVADDNGNVFYHGAFAGAEFMW